MSEENKVKEELKEIVKSRFCSKCGIEIQEGQRFCSSCGNEVDNVKINKFKLKVNKKIIWIIGGVILLLVVTAVVYSQSKEKQRQDARLQYMINVNEFKEKSINAGTNIEEIADTIQNYWNEYIFDKKHGYSIDSAVAAAIDDKSIEVGKAKTYDEEMLTLYRNLKIIPEGNEDLKDILTEVDDLYKSYSAFYDLAMEPSGNYTQYVTNNNNKTDEFVESYKALDNTIKTNPEFIEVEKMIESIKGNISSVMKEYKVICDSLPDKLDSDDDYKKLIPTFKDKSNIDISKVKKESEKFENNKTIKNALEIVSSTSEAYIKSIEYAKKYNQNNSKENLKEFKSAVLDLRAHVAMYVISVDSLDGDGESLNDKLK